MTMSIDDIISKVPRQYEKAKESGDLLFYPSTVDRHREPDLNVEFQIRVCPALWKKPQPGMLLTEQNKEAGGTNDMPEVEKQKPFDPFEPPYNENLYVGEVKEEANGEDYVVLLNKYSVVPNHFLLVSKEYKSQSSPLLPPDLVQIFKLLVAARNKGRRIFGFYNCGDLSGASQRHKHVQFIPVEETELGPPIERLARSINLETPTRPFTISRLPYANHVFRLPPDLQYTEGEELERFLADTFLSLLDLAISTVRHAPDYPVGSPSYNVIMTLEHIHLIPRRYENFVLKETGDVIGINALGFAGMLLVKTDEELEKVKGYGIGKMLQEVGLESVHELQIAGATDEAVNIGAAQL